MGAYVIILKKTRDSEEKQNTEVIKNRINDGGFFSHGKVVYTRAWCPQQKKKKEKKRNI